MDHDGGAGPCLRCSSGSEILMFYPCDNYVFSVPVVFRSKAQCEGNGYSIDERWNVVAKHHRDALWVCLSRPMNCIVSLINGYIAVSIDKQTEHVIITRIEH